ncbi:uncharacterized protein N7479_000312 [Penicillium vulpinum]|uniref:uncharacterized protein n=1 Tax=Penicillium vulpinum TaxID=29845 RepID=UPI0025486ED4|nr:uncharacterized protein N7479_000312 [Penicillium vulpinum]KAJ5970394.1 hypothetical protein N7479_000312 [Penicillium vulpinum]
MGFPLPPELIQIVLDFIIAEENAKYPPYFTQNTNLTSYATINCDWQRRSHVREIHFIAELDSYDGEARTRYENEEEMLQNSKVFTTSIQSLFNSLSEWPDNELGISLGLWRSPPAILASKVPRQGSSAGGIDHVP